MCSPAHNVQTIRAKPNNPGFLCRPLRKSLSIRRGTGTSGARRRRRAASAAMEFCPSCGLLLQIDPGTGSHRLRLFCPLCPYVCAIQNKIVRKAKLVKKEVEPIFSNADAMKLAPKTATSCPRCNHGEAYFKQMQIRSADEPMTTFYRCCREECQLEWRDD